MVGPWVVPAQRLADPLAVGVAATALGAAHPLVVQRRVDVHVALLALQASLGGDTEDSVHSLASYVFVCDAVRFKVAQSARFKPIKNGFPTGGMGRRGCCQMWVFVVKYFLLQRTIAVYPSLWLSGACSEGWGKLNEGLGKKK